MNAQKHRVKRVMFELSVEQEIEARNLYAKLGRIHHDRVLPLLERCFGELARSDELIRIDTVEVDVGFLGADTFEDGLVAGLRRSLDTALQREAAAARRRHSGNGDASGDMARLELLATYALSGCLPWWAQPPDPKTPATDVATCAGQTPDVPRRRQPDLLNGVVDALIETAPGPLRRTMPGLLRGSRSLARIVRALDGSRLSRLAALLSRLDAAAIDHYARELIRRIANDASLRKSLAGGERPLPGDAVRNLTWESVVTAAGHGLAGNGDMKRFLRAVLIQIASRSGTTFTQLVSTLHRSSDAEVGPRPAHGFQRTLDSLCRQFVPTSAAPSRTASAGADDGVAAARGAARADSEFARADPSGAASRGDSWLELLQQLRQPRHSADSTDRRRARDIADSLLDAGTPPPSALRRRLLDSEDALRDLVDPAMMEALRGMLTAPNEPPDRLTVAHEFDPRFAEAEEAYVDNAGLVILWPFLEHFFRRLDLLDDRRFEDIAAANRAVGLLQQLATGDPFGAEYLLPLNKVLCGREPADVFELGDPLSDVELAESDRLLESAIGNAPILRNMSVAGFRGSFLLRRGVLAAPDGAWILRVERETFDLVLERFPWSFDWIKLPWMPAALRVEW